MDRKDFETGIILGLCLPPVPQVVRTPIAYSYNGVVLPKLPERSLLDYPNAIIFIAISKPILYYGTIVYEKRLSNGEETLYFGMQNCRRYTTETEDNLTWIHTVDNPDETLWIESVEGTVDTDWTDTDILKADGTVFLKASDPIPIYE